MKALVSSGLPREKAKRIMGLEEQHERAELIIESLLLDRLISEVDGVLQLAL